MSNVAKLKEKARTLEAREQWKEALGALREVAETAQGEELEIGLWNRIGDLHARVGETERAVDAYEQAADAYAEAGLHNNAIALCRKVLRLVPGRVAVYRKLGRLSAAKGFLADARQNFLEFAERTQRAGQLDASFDALREFAQLSPDDLELQRLLAEQLRAHGRETEAVEQLQALRALHLRRGEGDAAQRLREEILLLDPDADPDRAPHPAPASSDEQGDGGLDLGYAALSLDSPEPSGNPLPGLQTTAAEDGGEPLGEIGALEGLETTAAPEGAEPGSPPELPSLVEPARPDDEAETEMGEPLPLLDFLPLDGAVEESPAPDSSSDGEEESEPLPLLELDADWQPAASTDDPLGALRRRVAADPTDEAARGELVSALAARGAFSEALGALRELILLRPTELALLQTQVEYAVQVGDAGLLVRAHLELARALAALGDRSKSRAVFGQVLELDPANAEARAALTPPPRPAPADYVDLRALLDEDEPKQTSTRFTVEVEPPSGDEDADFAELLSAFKQKVAEHIDAEDSSSHYDLGLAFMEMGLVDEAIAQFQVALRGGANPLATLEVLGRCFAEKGQHAVASKVLERATRLPVASDADLIGVLYELARAEEATGNRRAALDHLERVLAVDIRFRDAAARTSALRAAAL